MKRRLKSSIKLIFFLITFFILLQISTNIMVKKGNGYGSDITSFYALEENSLDLMFFGSSHSYATFSPEIIYENTGLKSYNFATQQQPLYITYYYMLEALKTQKPKTFVMEIRGAIIEDEYMSEGVTRDALDKMKPSYNKFNAINTSVKDFDDRCTYYFNIIKYHSRYNELTLQEIKDGLLQKPIENNGFTALTPEGSQINNDEFINIEEEKKLLAKNEEYLMKIIDLTNENNINLILVKSPCQLTEKDKKYFNSVKKIAEDNGLQFIDYNLEIDNLDLVFEDFYDKGHLSYSGAEKVSLDFSKRLNESI